MRIKRSFLLDFSRRFTALLLAMVMLFNVTSEAAAQYRSFGNGVVPQIDLTVKQDNTRIVSKDLSVKLAAAKLNASLNSLPVISADEAFKIMKASDTQNILSPEALDELYNDYLEEAAREATEVNNAFNIHKKDYNMKGTVSYVFKNSSLEKGTFCEGKTCYDLNNYLRGLLRAVIYQATGADSDNKDFKWNREVMLAYVPQIHDIVTTAGVYPKDVNNLQSYLRFILAEADDYCDNDFYLVDAMPGLASSFNGKSNGKASDAKQGKEIRRTQCSAVGEAMIVLGIIGPWYKDKVENATLIHSVMKDTYKDDYGATTLSSGIAALIAINTPDAYNHIEQFLVKESIPTASIGGKLKKSALELLGLLSLNAWVEKGIGYSRGGGGRFLNETGVLFQYIDEDGAREMGISDFSVQVLKEHPGLGYNIPYRNVFEDIGVMIASTGTKEGNAIAARILAKYNAVQGGVNACRTNFNRANPSASFLASGAVCDAGVKVHVPLVAGILQAPGFKSDGVNTAAKYINSLDWWDFNEATQRRINNSVSGKGNGVVTRSFDEARKKRDDRNDRIRTMSMWGDMFISAIFITMLVASLPSIVRSASTFASNIGRVRAINAAGKGNLLKLTKARIKAGGVSPASVKAAISAKRIEAAQVERANALLKKRGLAPKQSTTPKAEVNITGGKSTEGTLKISLTDKNAGKADFLSDARGNLTATVGEGGGGGASAEMTAMERSSAVRRAKWEAARSDHKAMVEAKDLMKETELRASISTKFKGNIVFNKPYKELSPLRKWAFDNYYFRLNPAFKISKEVTSGLARNPGKTAMFGSLPFGTTAEAMFANPIGIYTSISKNAASALDVVTIAKDAASVAGISAKTATTAKAVTGAMNLPSAAKGLSFGLPKLVAVLNEPHSGASGSARIANGESASLYTPAPEAPRKTPETPVNSFFDATSFRDTSELNGYASFESALKRKMSTRNMSKSNKGRHNALLSISRYISPRLASELLDIIDVNPAGYTTFDNFYELLSTKIGKLKPGQFITVDGYLPSAKKGALDTDEINKFLRVTDEIMYETVVAVSESENLMVQSILKKANTLTPGKQASVIGQLLDLDFQKGHAGFATRSYLVALSGDKYEWEDLSKSDYLKLGLGKEIKGDVIREVEKSMARKSKSGKSWDISYQEFKRNFPAWLADELGATRQHPAVWFENASGTYFIYSNDGSTRIRVGGHETLLSSRVNYHFHLEYLNTVEGNWTGPVNIIFRWPNQDLLPSDLIKEVVLNPIAFMESEGLVINRGNIKSGPFLKKPLIYNPGQSVRAKSAEVKLLPTGWQLTNESQVSPVQDLRAETRMPENFMQPAPVVDGTWADPLSMASFFMLPILMKFKGAVKGTGTRAHSSEQALLRPLSRGEKPASSEDLLSRRPDNPRMRIPVAEEGFKMAYIANETGLESALPIDISIDNRFKIKGYDRMVFNGEVAELRDGDKKPTVMSDFFMMLNGNRQSFAQFISQIRHHEADLEGDFKLKIVGSDGDLARKTVIAPLYMSYRTNALPIEVQMPAKMLPEGGKLIMKNDGTLAVLNPVNSDVTDLRGAHVRIPKNQIKNLVSVLKDSPRRFGLYVGHGTNKANVVIRDVSMTNVSLGKTFAPVVKNSLNMGEADATSLMFFVNYFLPGLSIFLNPVLKKVGENKLLLLSLAMSTLAGMIAISGGFYGFINSTDPFPWTKEAFVASITLMAVASVLKQLVSNMLIRANRGDVSTKTPASTAAAENHPEGSAGAIAAAADAANQSKDLKLKDVFKRAGEVFTKKSDVSMKDVFLYNKSFMFKNFGTLLFLAMPYAINETIRLISGGYDLGLDYSFSFPVYAVYSGLTTWKAYKAHLRDAYTVKKDNKATKTDDKNAVLSTPEAEKVAEAAIAKDHNILNVFLHKPGVWAISTAMVLATVHEFVLSSSFASILNASFDGSSAANFWVALCLYVPLVLGRLLGNVAGQRMSGSSLYVICSMLSAVGTAMVAGGISNPALVMAGASIASLGVGNFFTQMYNYLAEKHKDYNREISIILALTMSVAAIVALPSKYMVDYFGIANLGLMYALGCLIGSLLLTSQMMAGSTLYKYFKQGFKSTKGNGSDSGGNNSSEPGKTEKRGPNMNNPLPN